MMHAFLYSPESPPPVIELIGHSQDEVLDAHANLVLNAIGAYADKQIDADEMNQITAAAPAELPAAASAKLISLMGGDCFVDKTTGLFINPLTLRPYTLPIAAGAEIFTDTAALDAVIKTGSNTSAWQSELDTTGENPVMQQDWEHRSIGVIDETGAFRARATVLDPDHPLRREVAIQNFATDVESLL